MFSMQLGSAPPDFRRVALLEEQVDDMGIPTAPPKSTDSRSKNWDGDTAQLEAIPPDQLAQMARDAVEFEIDMDIHQDALEREARIRDRITVEVEDMAAAVGGYVMLYAGFREQANRRQGHDQVPQERWGQWIFNLARDFQGLPAVHAADGRAHGSGPAR